MPTSPGRRYVRFIVTSDRLSGAELQQRIGVSGDRTRTRGEIPEEGRAPSPLNAWELRTSLPPEESVERHLDQLLERIAPLRDSLRRLAREDCAVILRIVQYMEANEYQGYGIPIPRGWTTLLGDVGASIDIDQYVEAEG